MPCPNGILIKEGTKFDYNHSLVHFRVTKQITNQQVAINSLKSNKKVSVLLLCYMIWNIFKILLKVKVQVAINSLKSNKKVKVLLLCYMIWNIFKILLKVKVTNTPALRMNQLLNITWWFTCYHYHQWAFVCSFLAININPP